MGIAAHEAGHALQHAHGYAPLTIRNAAVPAASFGSGLGVGMIILGAIMQIQPLVLVGIGLFACVVFFQLVNLPVEFNASNRAKAQLVSAGHRAGRRDEPRQQRAECRGLDLRGRHAAVGDDPAVLRDALHRRQPGLSSKSSTLKRG